MNLKLHIFTIQVIDEAFCSQIKHVYLTVYLFGRIKTTFFMEEKKKKEEIIIIIVIIIIIIIIIMIVIIIKY